MRTQLVFVLVTGAGWGAGAGAGAAGVAPRVDAAVGRVAVALRAGGDDVAAAAGRWITRTIFTGGAGGAVVLVGAAVTRVAALGAGAPSVRAAMMPKVADALSPATTMRLTPAA